MSSNLPALREYLSKPASIATLQKVASSMVNPEHLVSVAMSTVATNPALLNCSPESMFLALAKCALVGLEPDGQMAAIVPYKGKATLVVMYQGMIDLSHRSGKITDIQAYPVYEKDTFAYQMGNNGFLHHEKYAGTDDPGRLIGAYSLVTYPNGITRFYFMTTREIEAIRKKSPNGSKPTSPWVTDTAAMYSKTAIRHHWKTLPKSAEIRRVLNYEMADEQGMKTRLDMDIGEVVVENGDQTPKAAAIADKIPAPAAPAEPATPPPESPAGDPSQPGQSGMFNGNETPEQTANRLLKVDPTIMKQSARIKLVSEIALIMACGDVAESDKILKSFGVKSDLNKYDDMTMTSICQTALGKLKSWVKAQAA